MKRKDVLRVFQVECDVDKYQYFLWDIPKNEPNKGAIYDACTCDGSSKADLWKPPPVFIYKPRHKRGDFWGVGMGSGGLGIAPWALDTVYTFAEMAGELLPLPYKGDLFTFLNITECIECLDPDRSEWTIYPAGLGKQIRKPFFRADRMCASTLFKSAHNPLQIYCLEYSRDPEEEFKACVEHHKLQGLSFTEVMIG